MVSKRSISGLSKTAPISRAKRLRRLPSYMNESSTKGLSRENFPLRSSDLGSASSTIKRLSFGEAGAANQWQREDQQRQWEGPQSKRDGS